jgi:TyrR family helix-turn-helix protein
MHSVSPRKNKPFVNLNCASIPNDLIESELFGYCKGAFSGASGTGKKGLIVAANTGTILLDEISELSMAAQAKLLTVIQDKEFLPVGAIEPVRVDVKIIAATNKNLKNMVEIGTFREDLFYRINVIDIYIPPLRKRRADIEPLIAHFLAYFNAKYQMTKSLSANAVKILCNYEWKGNVRELRHLIERLLVTTAVDELDETMLPNHVFGIVDHSGPGADENPAVADSYQAEMERYEGELVRKAYKECGSSRKLAEQLDISQTKASKLIRKYLQS